MTKRKTGPRKERCYKPPYDPTPEEIAAMCAEIRKGWSDKAYVQRQWTDQRADILVHKLHGYFHFPDEG